MKSQSVLMIDTTVLSIGVVGFIISTGSTVLRFYRKFRWSDYIAIVVLLASCLLLASTIYAGDAQLLLSLCAAIPGVINVSILLYYLETGHTLRGTVMSIIAVASASVPVIVTLAITGRTTTAYSITTLVLSTLISLTTLLIGLPLLWERQSHRLALEIALLFISGALLLGAESVSFLHVQLNLHSNVRTIWLVVGICMHIVFCNSLATWNTIFRKRSRDSVDIRRLANHQVIRRRSSFTIIDVTAFRAKDINYNDFEFAETDKYTNFRVEEEKDTGIIEQSPFQPTTLVKSYSMGTLIDRSGANSSCSAYLSK